jgi:hypothetical protein
MARAILLRSDILISLSVTLFAAMAARFSGLLAGYAIPRPQHQALRELGETEDVRLVGLLAEAAVTMEFTAPGIEALATSGLTRLLPRLKASDRMLFSPHQRDCLRQLLRAGVLKLPSYRYLQAEENASGKVPPWYLRRIRRNRGLMLAILKALEQIGDGEDLPIVEQLAAGAGMGQSAQVRRAAQECLPYLRQRAEQERCSKTYLRAANAPPPPAETLLRAAHGGPETDPQQLLRAGTAEQD